MTAPVQQCQPDINPPHVPAAFINALAEEGTKDEAIFWLQKKWNERCYLKARVDELERVLREARRFIDPDRDPTALTNRAMTLQINRALALSQEHRG